MLSLHAHRRPGRTGLISTWRGPLHGRRQRRQQALELNDTVLQGLIVAKMALDLDEPAKAREALTSSIESASRIITDLLGSRHHPLHLQRSGPAAVAAVEARSHRSGR